jgi:putative chitinase
LAQCSHESGGFKIVQENLNYSSTGLKNTFSKYFPGNLAESYARQAEKIASRVYGGRMGNGSEATKEGYRFRGRGYIQQTGKDNYTSFSKSINEDLISNPDLVSTKYPLLSAAWFFQRCLSKCDSGSSRDAITSVSKCVNGGTIGLEDRIKHFNEFYNLLK